MIRLFVYLFISCFISGQLLAGMIVDVQKAETKLMPDTLTLPFKPVAKVIVDGVGDDLYWKDISETKIYLSNKQCISFKSFVDKKKIYMLLGFDAVKEVKRHKAWKWDATQQLYVPMSDIEDTLSIIISNKNLPEMRDLWIWRSARTNPIGYGDDFHLKGSSENLSCYEIFCNSKPDKGVVSWFSKYYAKVISVQLKRFHNRKPTGSSADVIAVGKWKKGRWIIEISRKLNTGNSDDLELSSNSNLTFLLNGQGCEKGAESKSYDMVIQSPNKLSNKKELSEE